MWAEVRPEQAAGALLAPMLSSGFSGQARPGFRGASCVAAVLWVGIIPAPHLALTALCPQRLLFGIEELGIVTGLVTSPLGQWLSQLAGTFL